MDPITIGLAIASEFAPSIIKYFTNSDTAATVAGQVVDIAKTVTGKSTPEDAHAALQADPALAIQFQTAVMANETDIQKAILADMQSARARDVAVRQSNGGRNRRADIMLALTYGGLVALVVLMATRDIDANTALGGVVLLLIGKLIGQWETGFQFEFGTTRANKTKDETINNLTK